MRVLLLDIAWIAGILEGEGSFMLKSKRSYNGTICIGLQMSDFDVMERCSKILNAKLYGPYISSQKKKDGACKKETWMINIFGSNAASWMMTVFSFMGERRKEKICSLLEHWKKQQSIIPRMSSCHPEIKMFSKGYCKSCYMKNYHKERKNSHITFGH